MSFKNIKGQEMAIQILRGYLKHRATQGAYLFSGPEGVGKSLAAKTFAKAINCPQDSDDSCDSCVSCLKMDKAQHPDLHLLGLEDADAVKIDYIRSLKKEISLKPFEAKKKVFIINDAHNLTPEASSALLKVLEEPPVDSLIILVTAKPELLFDTIISRCKTVRFSSFSQHRLKMILKEEYNLDEASAHFIAYFSEGSLGSSLRLKDTDILKEKNRVIDEFALNKPNSRPGLPKQERQDLTKKLNLLATWFRDIYLLKSGAAADDIINLDRKDELGKLANRYALSEVEGMINALSDSLLYLRQNINVNLLTSNLKGELWKKSF